MSPLFRALRRPHGSGAHGKGAEAGPAENKLGLLRASDLFRDLSEEQMHRVEQMAVMTHCPRDRIIYAPRETGEALFLLKRGRVQVYRLAPDGKKLVVSSIGPGTLFGDMPFTGQRMLDSYAEAAEDSTLCVMSRHDVEDLILQCPIIGVRLLGALAERLREMEARLEESSLHDMCARVAAALLRASEHQGSSITVTHQELADLIGTYRETVTRALGELQERRLIGLQRGRIRIEDPDGLRELASGS